jgi:4-hydroxy-tetrahydrodipicolinate synthase
MQVAELACLRGRGRGAVVISVGAESSVHACRFAQHAEACGASAVMAIPPVTTALNDDQVHAYYSRIIESVAIPVIVQDASGYVGRSMSIGIQAQLLATYGDRVLFKPEAQPIGPRLSQLLEATGGRARVFEGSGGIALVDSFRRGIVGTMPGADLIAGIVALWRALQTGDDQRVRELSLPITALIAPLSSLDMFLAVEKHLLRRQGVFVNTVVRGPVGQRPDGRMLAEIERLFDRLTSVLEAQAAEDTAA